MRTARPSWTVTRVAQVSGQSCGQAPRTVTASGKVGAEDAVMRAYARRREGPRPSALGKLVSRRRGDQRGRTRVRADQPAVAPAANILSHTELRRSGLD